jgi:predicted nucleotidyltransferase
VYHMIHTKVETYIPIILERIRTTYNPVKIILFGSYVNGLADFDSDLDFLVVLKDVTVKNRRKYMVEMLNLMSDLPISKDILVYSPEELSLHNEKKWSIVYSAVQEGLILYESK